MYTLKWKLFNLKTANLALFLLQLQPQVGEAAGGGPSRWPPPLHEFCPSDPVALQCDQPQPFKVRGGAEGEQRPSVRAAEGTSPGCRARPRGRLAGHGGHTHPPLPVRLPQLARHLFERRRCKVPPIPSLSLLLVEFTLPLCDNGASHDDGFEFLRTHTSICFIVGDLLLGVAFVSSEPHPTNILHILRFTTAPSEHPLPPWSRRPTQPLSSLPRWLDICARDFRIPR